jgi:phosphate transport system ATP-binding protein
MPQDPVVTQDPRDEPRRRTSDKARPAGLQVLEPARRARTASRGEKIFACEHVSVKYAGVPAVRNVDIAIDKNAVTALIGPSGCGKSTLIRCFNRMNDLVPTATVEGSIHYHDQDLYGRDVDAVEVRKRIGMVFQKPNPFPKSIFDNIAFGPKILGEKKDRLPEIVETSLRRAALWEEVKDRLKSSALALSGGQQQRLCIARALATSPDVILMDEPCSALDPISSNHIENLMLDLREQYSIVIVTHNMQQAARVSDKTAFLMVEVDEHDHKSGTVVEYDDTEKIFTTPSDQRTEDYVTGKMG